MSTENSKSGKNKITSDAELLDAEESQDAEEGEGHAFSPNLFSDLFASKADGRVRIVRKVGIRVEPVDLEMEGSTIIVEGEPLDLDVDRIEGLAAIVGEDGTPVLLDIDRRVIDANLDTFAYHGLMDIFRAKLTGIFGSRLVR